MNPQRVQVPGNEQALLLTFFVERTLGVNGGVYAADTRARMSKNIKIHRVGMFFLTQPIGCDKAPQGERVARAII